MRSVFVYEFITGGGCWFLGDDPPAGSLLAEGTAMRDALAADFAALPDIDCVNLCHDARLPQPRLPKTQMGLIYGGVRDLNAYVEFACANTTTILIAPEFSGQLLSLAQRLKALRCQLISPGCDLIELCSNKQRTCDHLAAHGIRTPRGISWKKQDPPPPVDTSLWPAVLKPIDGCGSQGVQMIESAEELAAVDLSSETGWRLERFHPGLPVSVSLLTGPRGFCPLQPCTQNLSDDGRFTYRGGVTPLPPNLAERAQRLALAVAETLPPTKGYLGIDMVLGSAENGSKDVVIEINPRLTTSYLGLRKACEQNLAEVMLKWAAGDIIKLTWRPQTIEFAVAASQ